MRYFIAILIAVLLIASGCKKLKEKIATNLFEQYFEENILNKDFIVSYAKENSIDISSQYEGYIFKLYKNTYYDGPMTAVKDGMTINGTWTCNSDYGKLTINLDQPTTPNEFNFINREWRFTEKAIPVMKLAPWGSTADSELYMERL